MRLTDLAIALQSLDLAPESARKHILSYLNGSAADVTLDAPKRVKDAVRSVLRQKQLADAKRIQEAEAKLKEVEKRAQEALKLAEEKDKELKILEARVETLDKALNSNQEPQRTGLFGRR